MTLKEEMNQTRIQETTITEEELKEVVEKIKDAFRQWQQRDIDKSIFLAEISWNDDAVLALKTNEENKEEILVTRTIKSKEKQRKMIQKIEAVLQKEGIELQTKYGKNNLLLDLS